MRLANVERPETGAVCTGTNVGTKVVSRPNSDNKGVKPVDNRLVK